MWLVFHSLRFQVVQIKQVDCKMSTKNVSNYIKKKDFMIFLDNCTHKSIKPRISKYLKRLKLHAVFFFTVRGF